MKHYLHPLILIVGINSMAFSSTLADTVSEADKAFVLKAAQGGMTEVQLGQIASEKATSPDVKNFGAQMVTDHSKANAELKSLATTKGITLPTALDSKHQAMVDKLQATTGADFDRAYVAAMIKAHQKDDTLFSTEASQGQDSDIKAFASKTDQVVKSHLSMIQGIKSNMSASK